MQKAVKWTPSGNCKMQSLMLPKEGIQKPSRKGRGKYIGRYFDLIGSRRAWSS